MNDYSPPRSTYRPTFTLWGMVLLLALAWGLRIHNVEVRSLWADEGWTVLLSAGPRLSDVVQALIHDQHPPLFFVLFRMWRSVAGDSEFAMRAFNVLIGSVAVAGIYQLGRALFDRRTGTLAALILALADLHIDLSQEVRHYGLLAALIVFSSLFYAHWWHKPSRGNRLGYVASSAALLYTHYLGVYVLAAQTLHMLLTVRPWRRLAQGLGLLSAVGLAFAPWLPVLWTQNSVRWDNPLYYQNALPNSPDTYRAVRTALLGHYYAIYGLLALLGLVYVRYRREASTLRAELRTRPRWPVGYVLLWGTLAVGVTFALNARRPILTVRNFVVVVPALAVLVGHGLANLDRNARAFMLALILVVGLTTTDARRMYPNWRGVTRNVATYHLDNEPVLMDVWVGDFPVRYYVERMLGPRTPHISLREWRDTYRGQFLPTLKGYLQQQDAFWLVYWGDAPMDEYGPLIVEAGFERSATLYVDHQGTLLYSYRYDRRPAAALARFGDRFTLWRAEAPHKATSGGTLRVALWWSADETPARDYSVSVFLLGADGRLVAQHDDVPLEGHAPTSTWPPNALRFDLHRVLLPPNLPAGAYTLGVKLYWYGDGQPLPAVTESTPPADYLRLATVQVSGR